MPFGDGVRVVVEESIWLLVHHELTVPEAKSYRVNTRNGCQAGGTDGFQ
jgi:hypothetical protein